MCSIYGALGQIDERAFAVLRAAARDRGRDGGGLRHYRLLDGRDAWLGNWRAAPTTEQPHVPPQPYEGVLHNGTIANDRALGNEEGAVDSQIIPKVIDRSSVKALADSLSHLQGSYALAVLSRGTVYLATNYKPLCYYDDGACVYFSSMERHLKGIIPFGRRPSKLTPYSVLDLTTHEEIALPRRLSRKALVIASAGLDSTVAAWKLKADGYAVTLLHFLYGCRAERREQERIKAIAEALGADCVFVPLDYRAYAGRSPLLNTEDTIAGGLTGAEFAYEWVPARNLLMIAHAVAYAEAHGFGVVALGNNLEESGSYPDNEEEFTTLLDGVLDYAVGNGVEVRLRAPVGNLMKHEIAALGVALGAPLHLTWSCYSGGEQHCGQCGPCFMRREAFSRQGLTDPVFN